MKAKKRPAYYVGEPHDYWPVYSDAGRCLALCPAKEIAEMFVKLLKKRDTPTKGTASGEKT